MPQSKADIYVNESSTALSSSAGAVVAYCDDASHILMSGGCFGGSSATFTYFNGPVDADDASVKSHWYCGFRDTTGGTGVTIEAWAVCIAVD